MSDIKLFRTSSDSVTPLEGKSVALEKSLQTLIEKHLEVFFGIRFLATEYQTGKTHGGRIDTLGLDENRCPCILEYKRSTNENVINQGLFYLDWLLDHKGEFQLLVQQKLGKEESEKIEWSSPRLLCIAGDFTKYDSHAVQQINRNIELIRYLRYGDEFLLLELVNHVQATTDVEAEASSTKSVYKGDKTVSEHLSEASQQLIDLYEELKTTCTSLGDDVQMKMLKLYVAFKRMKNFLTVEVRSGFNALVCCVKVDPSTITIEDGFTRDVSKIGHWGTGDLEITIKNREDLSKAMPLIQTSYENS